MKKYVKVQYILENVLSDTLIFRFVNLSKDKGKMIDLYYFMEKLVSVLEWKKNNRIKEQFVNKDADEPDKL